ncbi:MAG TPA: tetratricopeptide repeat protein [Thermoanaerobaculia bacterium]|nr:tetratricopeptide repeat protein [Thermoanaerobaculia bacterium]
MRRILAVFVMLLVASAAMAQVRGKGRLQGVVTDKATGNPIAGATVTLSVPGGATQPIVVKTNQKGRWAALGLTSGVWNIDIAAQGFVTSQGTVQVSEIQMGPTIETKLDAEVKQEVAPPAPDSPAVPQEAVAAIRAGEDFMKGEQYKEAVAEFEKALPMVPTDTPELQTLQRQLQQVLSQAYYKAGELKKAIGMLEKVTAVDPFSSYQPQPGVQLLLVNLYLEDGQLEKAKALLEKIPEASITDPTVYINMGILFFNKKAPADAVTYHSKAIAIDPKSAEAYYYRGLALMQVKKNKEAKADFEKVLELAPESPEARDAKQLIAGLK